MLLDHTCEQCGSAFERPAWRGARRFCSRSCRTRWMRAHVSIVTRTAPKLTRPCGICGTLVTKLASKMPPSPACTPACVAAMARERQREGAEKICAICAGTFYVSPSRQRTGPALTCSLTCRAAWQRKQPRKSTTRNSAAYKDWRAAVYRRDDYTCQRCGKRGGHDLHAHHIKYWATHPELRFEVGNGKTLCAPCHSLEHADVAVLR